MAEAAILRVRHCGADIFCRRPPRLCPACGLPLRGAGLAAAPLRLPSPFRHGHRQPRAFLLRPTTGTFLGGYDGKSDLHVGITNSNGVVYNYDQEGIQRAETGWEQCISIPLVQPDMFGLLQQWDQLLEEFSVGEAWLPHRFQPFQVSLHLKAGHSEEILAQISHPGDFFVLNDKKHKQAYCQLFQLLCNRLPRTLNQTSSSHCLSVVPKVYLLLQNIDGRYEEDEHNCYTFTLAFLNSVLAAEGKQQLSKREFTERFVIPQTKRASKYITLQQELTAKDFYIVPLPDPPKGC